MTMQARFPAVLKSACLALSVSFAAVDAGENNPAQSRSDATLALTGKSRGIIGGHLSVSSRIRDVLDHPGFRGFAHLLLPWGKRDDDLEMPLSNLGTLLPYHTHVDAETSVRALNRLLDDVGTGNAAFYDFYTDSQKQEQPARENTGLFFFRGKPGAPFALIAPGGGFAYVASLHEGFPYAEEISAKGFNAFVLKYRAGYGGAVATQDMAAAISYIFRNAQSLGVGTQGYSLWGSSAGARMAAAIGSHGTAAFGANDLPKPSAVVMAYTAHSDYSSREPSTFVVVGEDDGIAPPAVMERRVAALRRAGAEVDYRKYGNVGHGFGRGTGTSADGWVSAATAFWGNIIKKK